MPAEMVCALVTGDQSGSGVGVINISEVHEQLFTFVRAKMDAYGERGGIDAGVVQREVDEALRTIPKPTIPPPPAQAV
jgi:hypothetical protein